MDKHFQLDIGNSLMYLANLVDGQFAGKHYPRESQTLQPSHLVGSAVVGLGTGMTLQRQAYQHIEQCHVLNKDGVNPNVGKVAKKAAGSLQFAVVDNSVDCDIHLSPKPMGIAA